MTLLNSRHLDQCSTRTMKYFNTKAIRYVVIAGAMLASSAQAGIISVNDNHSNSQYMSTYSAINGQFDLRSQLDSNSTIDWARVTFTFSDDYDPLRYAGSYGSYRNGRTYRYRDARDTAMVTIPQQGSVVTSSPYSSTTSYRYRSVHYTAYRNETRRRSYRCGFLGLRTCYRTYTVRVPYTAYRSVRDRYVNERNAGIFSTSFLLGGSALRDLLDTGTTDFQVRSRDGDFYFRNAQLTASISSVPEPSTMALFGMGALGLVLARRKLRRSAA